MGYFVDRLDNFVVHQLPAAKQWLIAAPDFGGNRRTETIHALSLFSSGMLSAAGGLALAATAGAHPELQRSFVEAALIMGAPAATCVNLVWRSFMPRSSVPPALAAS